MQGTTVSDPFKLNEPSPPPDTRSTEYPVSSLRKTIPDGDGLQQPLPVDVVGQFAECVLLDGFSRVYRRRLDEEQPDVMDEGW